MPRPRKTKIPQTEADLEIVYRDPATLIPYENNSRTHSPQQIEQIRASIRAFGFTNPILLREDGVSIGAGHARQEAALAEGLTRVPTVILPGLSDTQWRAYVIADNKLALGSGWDLDVLKAEIDVLKGLDFDVSLTGFDSASLLEIFAEPPEPEPPAPPKVSLSDKFGVPPFSVLNAREGWWQDRKRAWLSLGIKSEIGRGEAVYGENASPGGSPRPATDYSKSKARGNGKGQAL